MLKEIKSKYQAKNYEEIEYELEKRTCRKCDRPYMVDPYFLKTVVENDEDWEVNICPYCGYKWHVCL